jgi:hypothetical protein
VSRLDFRKEQHSSNLNVESMESQTSVDVVNNQARQQSYANGALMDSYEIYGENQGDDYDQEIEDDTNHVHRDSKQPDLYFSRRRDSQDSHGVVRSRPKMSGQGSLRASE